MILPFSSLVGACLVALVFQSNLASAETAVSDVQTAPACSLKCTLDALEQANCQVPDIQNCLCRNDTLLLDLSQCVIASCNESDRNVATNILQTQICLGVPHESRETYIIRAEIILAAFTYPVIILRFVSRIWVARRVWWDDWMILIATVLMIPNTAIPIWTAYHGFGLHIWNVSVQDQIILTQLYLTAQVFYAVIQNLAKLSILFLYLRIFPTPKFRLVVQGCIILIACHTIAFTIGVAAQCLPVYSLWNLSVKGKCIDIHGFALWGAGLSIFYDIVIILLPVSELIGLNLSMRKRIALCFMFALGSFACVCSMIRIKYLKDFYPTIDNTWASVDPVIWSDIETYAAIICSCLMCIRPLLMKAFPTLFPTTQVSHNASDASANPNSLKKRSGFASSAWSKKKFISGSAMSGSRLSSSFGGLGSRDGGEERETAVVSDGESGTIIIQGPKVGVLEQSHAKSEHGGVRVEFELEQRSERRGRGRDTPETPTTPGWFANGNVVVEERGKGKEDLEAQLQEDKRRLIRMSSWTV